MKAAEVSTRKMLGCSDIEVSGHQPDNVGAAAVGRVEGDEETPVIEVPSFGLTLMSPVMTEAGTVDMPV